MSSDKSNSPIINEYPILRGISSFTVGFGNFCLFTLAFLFIIVALMFYGMAQTALGSITLGLRCPSFGDLLEIGAAAGVFSFLIPLVVVSVAYALLARRRFPSLGINARLSSFGTACLRLGAWLTVGAVIASVLQGVLAWGFLHDRSNGLWSPPDQYAPIETLDDEVTFNQVYQVSVIGAALCNALAVLLLTPLLVFLLRRRKAGASTDIEQLALDEKAAASSALTDGNTASKHSGAPSYHESSLIAYESSVQSAKIALEAPTDHSDGHASNEYAEFRESKSPWSRHSMAIIEEK